MGVDGRLPARGGTSHLCSDLLPYEGLGGGVKNRPSESGGFVKTLSLFNGGGEPGEKPTSRGKKSKYQVRGATVAGKYGSKGPPQASRKRCQIFPRCWTISGIGKSGMRTARRSMVARHHKMRRRARTGFYKRLTIRARVSEEKSSIGMCSTTS